MVREAIATLRYDDMVEARQGAGVFVRHNQPGTGSPFPLPDISSIYESVHTTSDGLWKREWQQVDKGLAPNSGSWTLIAMPDDDTRTLAKYRVRVAPLIPIPKRIVQFAHDRVVPDVFRHVDKHARKVVL